MLKKESNNNGEYNNSGDKEKQESLSKKAFIFVPQK